MAFHDVGYTGDWGLTLQQLNRNDRIPPSPVYMYTQHEGAGRAYHSSVKIFLMMSHRGIPSDLTDACMWLLAEEVDVTPACKGAQHQRWQRCQVDDLCLGMDCDTPPAHV
jgi:hypothetical protein